MTTPLPISATKLAFAYNDREDRLTLVASNVQGTGVHTAITRRLIGRLINGLAGLLERSNPTADKAPAELRDDIILMEHQEAVFGRSETAQPASASRTAKAPSNLPAPRLVSAVNITVTPKAFQLQFSDAKTPLFRVSLGRLDVHRLIEVMSRRAEAADWNISIDATWLEPGQTEIVFN